jgi:3-hydroxyacyl-CoA dehydrogenase / enoyl-CoA hydratase / 3-hydroxybutyryl-CoA epimerase
VCVSVGKELAPFLGLEIPQGLDQYLENGRGKKDGRGIYTWEDGKPKKPEVDPDYKAADDLTDRMILPMLNEAVACLNEGVVDEPDLLDAGVIFGTGFAPFRGGPIQYIRETGAHTLLERLQALESTHGARFSAREGWDDPRLAGESAEEA